MKFLSKLGEWWNYPITHDPVYEEAPGWVVGDVVVLGVAVLLALLVLL